MLKDRRWLIIPTSVTESVNFNEVLEPSSDNLRVSLNGELTFVKYDITEITASYETYHTSPENPDFITSSYKAGIYGRPSIYVDYAHREYTHEQILDILTGSNWVETGSLE